MSNHPRAHAHEGSHSEPLSMSNIEERLREPIEKALETAQETAKSGLTRLADYVTQRPLRSMGVAVVAGFCVARILQKIRA